MYGMDDYRKCVKSVTNSTTIPHIELFCSELRNATCPTRFGENYERSTSCRQQIMKTNVQKDNTSLDCKYNLLNIIKPCVTSLISKCNQSDIVATKSVRLSMDTVELLLKLMPDLKVIHYIRDPRAVALSRQMDNSVRGIYARKGKGDTILKAGKLYCQDLERDMRTSRYLQKLHPKNIKEIYYEELATFPNLIANRIYDFIEHPVPQQLYDWISNNTNSVKKGWTSRVSVNVISKWTKHISNETRIGINKYCKEVFNMAKIKWAMSEE